MTLADAVSLRSRRRKLRLFLEEMRPTAETTVVDVGADEVGFGSAGGQGGCATHNFFEELYPWREQLTAVSGASKICPFRNTVQASSMAQSSFRSSSRKCRPGITSPSSRQRRSRIRAC